MEQELLLLGLLRESPKHGYEIKKKIREILTLFAGIELKSIYYPLEILEKKGLVAKRLKKQGNRPEKIVYELTPKGSSRFEELLGRSLLELKRPQFSLDLSLYFLHYLKPEVAKRRLQGRMLFLKKIERGLKLMQKGKSGKRSVALDRILEHNLKMLQAEMEFLKQLT